MLNIPSPRKAKTAYLMSLGPVRGPVSKQDEGLEKKNGSMGEGALLPGPVP